MTGVRSITIEASFVQPSFPVFLSSRCLHFVTGARAGTRPQSSNCLRRKGKAHLSLAPRWNRACDTVNATA